jgi:ABC-2 type transport system permease protein
VVLTLVAALAAVAMGLLIASFARSASQAANLGTAAGFIFGLVGGAVPVSGEPFSRMGGFISILSRVTPQAHALEGFLKVMAEGKGLAGILPELGILLGMAALFLVIAIRRFRYE